MPAGRPTLYKPEYCELLVQHMTDGLSFESFAGKIGTCRSILYDWVRDHPEFSDAKSHGWDASLLYWELQGRNSLWEKQFQASVYVFTMKARFKWADQVVIKDEKEEVEREKIKKLPMSELLRLVKENLSEEMHEEVTAQDDGEDHGKES